MSRVLPTLLLLTVQFYFIYNLKYDVVLERPEVVYFNKKFLNWSNLTVTRYGRRSVYYLNVEGDILHTWGNNVSLDLVFYEFLSNEYRRSFVEMHFKLCTMLLKDPYIGVPIRKALGDLSCPIPKGVYHLMNLTIPTDSFTSVWPFQKSRVEVNIFQTDTKEDMVTMRVDALFKQVSRKANKT